MHHDSEKKDILQFLFILAEQSASCTIWVLASHHMHIFCDSVQPLLALSEQRALCTFFSLLLSASLLRCGLMVSSQEPFASSGGHLPEALFLVFRLESQGAKVCSVFSVLYIFNISFSTSVLFSKRRISVDLVDLVKSFQTNIYLQKLASIQKRTSPIKFAHLAEKSENGSISNLSTKVSSRRSKLRHPWASRTSRVSRLRPTQ